MSLVDTGETYLMRLHRERKARLLRLGNVGVVQPRVAALIESVIKQIPSISEAINPRCQTIRGAPLKSAAYVVAEYAYQIKQMHDESKPNRPAVKAIINKVAQHFKISVHDILSERRDRAVVRPRQVAMYLAKTMTLRSLPDIGRQIGGRDHTTVLHGTRVVARLMHREADFCHDVATIEQAKLEGGGI